MKKNIRFEWHPRCNRVAGHIRDPRLGEDLLINEEVARRRAAVLGEDMPCCIGDNFRRGAARGICAWNELQRCSAAVAPEKTGQTQKADFGSVSELAKRKGGSGRVLWL